MELGSLLFLLLVLACPLAMLWMMRSVGHGSHDHASHGAGHGCGHGETPRSGSVDELRRRRAELDAEIAALEETEADSKMPTTA
jgi:hypothetical protein